MTSDNQSMEEYSDLEVLLEENEDINFDDVPSTSQSLSATQRSDTPGGTRNKSKSRDKDGVLHEILSKIENLEENEEKDRTEKNKWNEKIFNLELEKKEILNKIAKDNEEIKKEIINFLKKQS